MKKQIRLMTLFSVAGALALFSVGCTESAQQDLNQAGENMERAGENVGQATEKSVEATGEAVERAGEEVVEGTQEAARMTGEAVGGAVRGVADAGEDAGAKLTVTPTVKGVLIADKTINAAFLNVETNEDAKTVTILGKQKTAAQKDRVTSLTQQTLREHSWGEYKVVNKVAVDPTLER